MRQYERYLFTNLIWPTVLTTAALTGVIWLTQVLRFIDFMLNRGLTMSDFLYLTGLMLPSLLLIIIPIGVTIAVIYTYNRLRAESELIVLSAVGVSRLQMARPMVLVAIICLLVCYLLSDYLMPSANHKFRDIRTFFRDKYSSMLLEENVFNTPIDGLTVFIRERDKDNTLHGILLHDNRNLKEVTTMMAERGHLEQTKTGPRFYLEHGQRQQMKDGKVSWLSFDNYTLDLSFYAKDIARKRDPDERSILELFTARGDTPKEEAAMRAEGHQRLTWPVFAVALPLLALAILFSGEFNRRGQWKRVVEAAVAVTVLLLLFSTLRNFLIKHMWMAPGLYLIVIGTIGLALYMLGTGNSLPFHRLRFGKGG